MFHPTYVQQRKRFYGRFLAHKYIQALISMEVGENMCAVFDEIRFQKHKMEKVLAHSFKYTCALHTKDSRTFVTCLVV